jgi:hypothetical protein
MHPFTLPQPGRAITESRSSRRRRRRAAIAVVTGLLAVPGSQAFADPPQVQFQQRTPHVHGPQGWHQAAPAHLPGGHHVTGGRTLPDPTPVATDSGGGSADWAIPGIVAASLLTAGGIALTQRRHLRTAS